MPPQLTETWGAAYIQVLIVLLVFALGIPALIFQVAVPEEVRRLIYRHTRMKQWFTLILVFIISLIALCFVWFLHPCSGGNIPEWKYWTAGALMTVAIILSVLLWLRNLGKFVKKTIIRDLVRSLSRAFHSSGILQESHLDDLIYLGEKSEPGYEKELALSGIERLANYVQNSKRYTGYELEYLLKNIDRILMSEEKKGNYKNYESAVHMLGNILKRLRALNLYQILDAELTLRTLGKIGVAAIQMNYESISHMILEIVECSEKTIFEIGLFALKSMQFLIATAALNKLESLAVGNLPISPQRSVSLLGLTAHFWESGKSSRRRAKSFLFLNKNNFSPFLNECLRYAIEYHYSITQFDTADKLINMLNEIGKE